MPLTRTSGAVSRWQTLVDAGVMSQLPFDDAAEAVIHPTPSSGPRSIEEKESWRKEMEVAFE